MASYTPEQIVGVAGARYAECKSLIQEMSDVVKSVSPDFSFEIAMRQFDIVLQTILLCASLKDKNFEAQECALMRAVTEYADVLPIINAKFKEENADWPGMDWGDINLLTEENKENLTMIVGSMVEKYATEFVSYFAVVDKVVTEKDYMVLLDEAITGIIFSVALIDGDDIDSDVVKEEAVSALAMYNVLLKNKWKEMVESN